MLMNEWNCGQKEMRSINDVMRMERRTLFAGKLIARKGTVCVGEIKTPENEMVSPGA